MKYLEIPGKRKEELKLHLICTQSGFFFCLALKLQILIMTLKYGGLEVLVGRSFVCILNSM